MEHRNTTDMFDRNLNELTYQPNYSTFTRGVNPLAQTRIEEVDCQKDKAGKETKENEAKPVEEVGGRKTFTIRKEPYDKGHPFYAKSRFTIDEGVTVLVGCNGSGKTTLMTMMKEYLKEKDRDTVILSYTDTFDGRATARSKSLYEHNLSFTASLFCSSEGEQLYLNVGAFINKIGRAVRQTNRKNIWVFLDGVDSGMSIDKVIELRAFLHELPNMQPDRHFYFIVSANAFELARGEKCLDVANMKFVKFYNYEKYMKFVLASREQKDKRDSKEE